jgi:DNA-binding CsgD family transcriptional regulator
MDTIAIAQRFELSKRQTQVAEHIARGLTNLEIADALGITEKGVKFHATRIYRACSVKGRAEFKALVTELTPCQSSA